MKLTEPDKGWSWMVMIGSFGAHVVSGTFMYAAGITHNSLLERFHDDPNKVSKTSWAGGMFLFLLAFGGKYV